MTQAIIIPVHRWKANWLTMCLNSLKIAQSKAADSEENIIVLACSNYTEAAYFGTIVNTILEFKNIKILDVRSIIENNIHDANLLSYYDNNENRSIINIKKLVSLYWASENNIEFCLTIDADTYFLKNISSVIHTSLVNYKNKILLGSLTPDDEEHRAVCATCLDLLSKEDQDSLRQIKAEQIYTWFLEPPSFQNPDLKEFFAYMTNVHGSIANFLRMQKYHSFEHTTYSYFLSAKRGWTLKSYDCIGIGNRPEDLNMQQIQKISQAFNYDPAWLPANKAFSEFSIAQSLFPNSGLLYHTDRGF